MTNIETANYGQNKQSFSNIRSECFVNLFSDCSNNFILSYFLQKIIEKLDQTQMLTRSRTNLSKSKKVATSINCNKQEQTFHSIFVTKFKHVRYKFHYLCIHHE